MLVLNNGDLNFVSWEQRLMQGDPRFKASQELPPFNYADYANSLSLQGIRVVHPDELDAAWDQALQADRPVVLEVLTDAEVVTFTPEVAVKHADKLAEAIGKGDTAAGQHLDEPLRTAVQEKEKQS